MKSIILISLSIMCLFSCGKQQLTSNQVSSEIEHHKEQFQIGNSWDRINVNFTSIDLYTKPIQRLIQNTSKVNVLNSNLSNQAKNTIATAIYLGRHSKEEFLFATAGHIFDNIYLCNGLLGPIVTVTFHHSKKIFNCERTIYTGKNIDLAIFTIKFKHPIDQRYFNELSPYSFKKYNLKSPLGTQIITAGHGHFKNQSSSLTIIEEYCLFYPEFGISKINGVYSRVTDCDVSSGDSGSAVINAHTGNLQGVFWASSGNKPPQLTNQDYVYEVLNKTGHNVLNDFSYFVPNQKIVNVLRNYVKNYRSSKNKKKLSKSKVIYQMLKRMKIRL